MRFLAFCALFVIGAILGIAVVPLLPDRAQERIGDFQQDFAERARFTWESIDLAATPGPTSTPLLVAPRVAQPTATPKLSQSPTPIIAPPSTPTTPTRTATPRPTSTPRPTATPTPSPTPTLEDLQLLAVDLINRDRAEYGVTPVALGGNSAAQRHAESSLENCFSSHWGMDGLKPYMRYSLAGGYQSNGENGYGSDYCIKPHENYLPLKSIEQEIDDAMRSLMDSPGHRRNILDPTHKKVNIGLAWDRFNIVLYQHFEGDYVEYDTLPTIEGTVLSLSGRVKNGVRFTEWSDLGVQVYYDPPFHPLTRGQLSRTYCYDNGRLVGSLRRPLSGREYWPTDEYTTIHEPCPSPYDVSPEAPAPSSPFQAHEFWLDAYGASLEQRLESITVPWITASAWNAAGTDFSVKADMGDLPAGVYTVMVWAPLGGEDIVISQYSIFHEVTPPDTYYE